MIQVTYSSAEQYTRDALLNVNQTACSRDSRGGGIDGREFCYYRKRVRDAASVLREKPGPPVQGISTDTCTVIAHRPVPIGPRPPVRTRSAARRGRPGPARLPATPAGAIRVRVSGLTAWILATRTAAQ